VITLLGGDVEVRVLCCVGLGFCVSSSTQCSRLEKMEAALPINTSITGVGTGAGEKRPLTRCPLQERKNLLQGYNAGALRSPTDVELQISSMLYRGPLLLNRGRIKLCVRFSELGAAP
jgi:hypothetical protein